MVVRLIKPVLAPVLIAQAKRLRRIALEMPEPLGLRHGLAGSGARELAHDSPNDHTHAGTQPTGTDASQPSTSRPFSLLVAGDSSAAGVGAATQDEALASQLAQALATRIGRDVQWQLVAQTGLTSHGLHQLLLESTLPQFDAAVIIVGVNDITNNIALSHALRARSRIVRLLRMRNGVQHIVFPGLPAVERFPLLPQPLAWYGGAEARRNNALQRRWATHPQLAQYVSHLNMDGFTHPKLMASDGFHPSPILYTMVAAHMAEHIAARVGAAIDLAEK